MTPSNGIRQEFENDLHEAFKANYSPYDEDPALVQMAKKNDTAAALFGAKWMNEYIAKRVVNKVNARAIRQLAKELDEVGT